jgi:hypothetical protein
LDVNPVSRIDRAPEGFPPFRKLWYDESDVQDLPYNSYALYLREKYDRPAYRVSVDGGFSCPNRSGRSGPGCSYCDEQGSRAPYLAHTAGIEEQVRAALGFLRSRYNAEVFLLYFQAFSSTNAKPRDLERIYDAALDLAEFRELIVSTRPDCVDEEKAALLGSYRARGLDVWLELGLQSARDRTLQRIGRGHSAADFSASYDILKRHGLKVAVHLIFGLPGESAEDIRETVRFTARLEPDGVKIHNLHIPARSPLAGEFLRGEITAPGPQRHMEYLISALEHLPAGCLIMRLTCDTPRERLHAPRWFGEKQSFRDRLVKEMRRRGARQGRLYAGLGDGPRTPPEPPGGNLDPCSGLR